MLAWNRFLIHDVSAGLGAKSAAKQWENAVRCLPEWRGLNRYQFKYRFFKNIL